ncbi:MAG: hypothetical protein ACM3ZQ_00120 [Bacillota bacterium]
MAIRLTDLAFTNSRFNIRRLHDLVAVYGPSKQEQEICTLAGQLLSEHCTDIETDNEGNLYAIRRGEAGADTVLLCAHMDTVFFPPQERVIVTEDGYMQLGGITLQNSIAGTPILGGDDRAGMEIILSILESYQGPLNIKVLFTVREEIGGQGMHDANRSFLAGIGFGLVLDRKHSGDVVTIIERKRLCDRKLTNRILKAGRFAHVRDLNVTDGAFSDAYFLSRRFQVPCANLSVGYYHPHSPMERIDLHALDDSVRWVQAILDSCEHDPVQR